MTLSINKKLKGGNVILKVDMAMVYDWVNWKFLQQVLKSLRFSNLVRWLISKCIEILWNFVMMNGTTKGFLKFGKRLRQDDPLSPYLFILMEEVLSRMLNAEFEGG